MINEQQKVFLVTELQQVMEWNIQKENFAALFASIYSISLLMTFKVQKRF